MSNIKIAFNVTGKFTQELKMLDQSITAEDLYAGLNNGEYVATLVDPHKDEETHLVKVDDNGELHYIASVIRQRASENLVLNQFRVSQQDGEWLTEHF